ncbi:MAG: hypothetical protein P8Y48_00075 [Novosphingobium sp.]
MSMNPLSRIRRRPAPAIRAGASLAAISLAIALAQPAQAQSFDGTYNPTFPLGFANIFTSPGGGTPATPPTTTIEVYSPQTVIDWTPNDTTGTGTVNFQPAGTTAIFTNGTTGGVTDFTVLNRIVPTDPNGAPQSRAIAFNGAVQSLIYDINANSAPGGHVWFYSPTGIVVGSTAKFDVGSLVLTTDPIDLTDGLFGTNGEIRFRGNPGSTGYVQINSGAQIATQINPATLGSAYVALVAPHIEQGGTIAADGPVALVAAEQVDITINAGLFDIAVTQGTSDGNGIVHTGSTGGPTTVASGSSPQVALVAVPKNDGMTMLLSGTMGYTPATVASPDGGAVVLSAGNGLGYDSTGAAATGNITIGDAVFTSALKASASDTISVTPANLTQFNKAATLSALQTVDITAADGAIIDAQNSLGLSLDVYAGNGVTGGTINVGASAGGAINAQGRLRLGVQGTGTDNFLDASSVGGDGMGGTIAIDIGDGTLSTALSLEIDASGSGGASYGQGGNGIGGTVGIAASQGTITTGSLDLHVSGSGGSGDVTGGNGSGGSASLSAAQGATADFQSIYADAYGYGGTSYYGTGGNGTGGNGTGGALDVSVSGGSALNASGYASFNATGDGAYAATLGGNGTGGAITLTDTGGILGFYDLHASANSRGGSSDTSPGSAMGGSVLISLSGSDQNWGNVNASGNATAGNYYGSGGGTGGGNATADTANGVSLAIDGVSLSISGDLSLNADAYGNIDWDSASLAGGGRANLSVANGGSLSTDRTILVSASAFLSLSDLPSPANFTSSLQGGTASVDVSGGTVTVSQLDAVAKAEGMGALMAAGNATGGAATVTVANGGSLAIIDGSLQNTTGALTVSAGAIGDFETLIGTDYKTLDTGYAASAQGGNASLQLDGGQISTFGNTLVSGSGRGGPSGNGTDGGAGTGGTALVAVNGGTFTPGGDVDVLAKGTGGLATSGATGGHGIGGTAAWDATGGTTTVAAGNLTISAQGLTPDIALSATGSSGDAAGGTARLSTHGTANLGVSGTTRVLAGGQSGSASGSGEVAGMATGGSATIRAQAGSLSLTGTQVNANALFGAGNAGDGRTSTAGTADIGAVDGTLTVAGGLTVSALSRRESALTDYAGLGAQGGAASAFASGSGSLTVTGDTSITASATGGTGSINGSDGGDGTAGTARIGISNGGTAAFGGTVSLTATGTGGAGAGANSGGGGFGGTTMIAQTGGTTTITGILTATANGIGGTGNGGLASGTATGGSASLTASAGNVTIGANATFTADATAGTGSTSTAGFIGFTGGTVTPGGTIAVGGALTASALGDSARSDGLGLDLQLTGSTLSVTGNSTIGMVGNAVFDITGGGLFTTGGVLAITTPARVSSTGSLTATGAVSILADSGIDMSGLSSSGTTLLQAVNGAVTVSDLLSNGLVTALGRSVDITSSGGLSFADADATAGNLSVAAANALLVPTADATGTVSLSSSGGTLTATGAVNGAGITLAAGDAITANGAITSSGALSVTGSLTFASSAPVTSAGAASIIADHGIDMASLSSGGTTLLQAPSGPVTVSELLSSGLVTVASASSVDITSSGSLSFADITGLDLAIDTAGDLSVASVQATGGLSLRSRGGSITGTGSIDGAGVSLAANGDITFSNTLISRDALGITGNLGPNGVVNTAGIQLAAANPTTPGTLSITTPGRFTSGSSITASGNVSILADSGIDVASLSSGGTTLLQAVNGPVAIPALLSNGLVTVLGQTVDISSSGALSFSGAQATAGNLSIATAGDLLVATTDATGAVSLSSSGGAITGTGAVSGAGITLTAANNITAGGALTSSNALAIDAGQTFSVGGVASGTAITVTSSGIAIGANGRLGVRGTTATVDLANRDTVNPSSIGGSAAASGYSLDGDSFARIFADAGITYHAGTGVTSIGDLSLAFGPSGNIGSGGTLSLQSDGRITINGDIALGASGTADTLAITAQRLNIVADSGSLAMTDSANTPSGTLLVDTDVFAVATAATLDQLDPGGDIGTANALLNRQGAAGGAATLAVGAIEADITNGIYVQNLGTSSAYADRRGFAVNALAITTGGANTQIAINGLTRDAGGNEITGLDTAATITVNGLAATSAGTFDPNSTINGCVIGQSCVVTATDMLSQDELPTKTDLASTVASGGVSGVLDIVVPPVELKENDSNPLLPLVDEPVTGVGNEDLWGDRCVPSVDSCGNSGQ